LTQFVDELSEHLAVLWDEYAEEDPANLSEAAAALRTKVRASMEELPIA